MTLLPRLYRSGLLFAVAGLLYASAIVPRPPDDIPLEAARTFFPETDRLAAGDARLGGQTVLDRQRNVLGLLLTTSPHTDDLVGYAGPSNLLIALSPDQQVVGVKLLSSGDTQAHVDQVEQEAAFWQQFVGVSPASRPPEVEGVGGSTLTSMAMAEAIQRRLGGSSFSPRFPDPVTLEEVKKLFPGAHRVVTYQPRGGWHQVEDEQGQVLGYAVRTSPYSDNGRGYRGPTETLVAVDVDGKTVTGVLLRKSYDTEEYVDRVRDDEGFQRLLAGRTIDDWAQIDFAREGIEGVSGATQTSFAVADGIKRRFAADQAAMQSEAAAWNFNPGLLAVIAGGLAITFTPLRTNRRLKWLWAAVLIIVFAFWLGDILSLSLLAGWARSGVSWRTAWPAVLLAGVALLVPWASRRQIYCQQLCPHGAAQTWLGQFKRMHLRVPVRIQTWLMRLPGALLLVGLVLATFFIGVDLAWLEPFDAWVLKGAAAVSAGVAVVGLIASLFIPQAYCRYGCPTGELLRMIRSGGAHDRLQRRDVVAGAIVLLIAGLRFGPSLASSLSIATPAKPLDMSDTLQFEGRAFGTTWSVKLRKPSETGELQGKVASELERIESILSHWRKDSFTAQFNASETTLETDQPPELVALVSRAQELSRKTNGVYDITVAPLVDAWGYGPSGERSEPSDEELAELLQRTGHEKLTVDTQANTLRKSHPQLQIDLGSLLQGYAADQLGNLLQEVGVEEFLIDVGGELLARGEWNVAIEDPRDPAKPLRTLRLRNAALATSGLYHAKKMLASGEVHHLISPQTGRPIAATPLLCAVSAPTAVEADAWATALLAVGLPDSLTLADEQHLAVLLLDRQQGVQTNSRGSQTFEE